MALQELDFVLGDQLFLFFLLNGLIFKYADIQKRIYINFEHPEIAKTLALQGQLLGSIGEYQKGFDLLSRALR